MSPEEANYRPRRAAAPADDEGRDWSTADESGAEEPPARGSRYADDAPDSVDDSTKGRSEPIPRGRRAFDDAPAEDEVVAEPQHSPRRGLGFADDDSADEGTDSDAPVGRRGARTADEPDAKPSPGRSAATKKSASAEKKGSPGLAESDGKAESPQKPAKQSLTEKPAKQSLTEKVAAKASALTDKLKSDKGEKPASEKSEPTKPSAGPTGATTAAATTPRGATENKASQNKPAESKATKNKSSQNKGTQDKPAEKASEAKGAPAASTGTPDAPEQATQSKSDKTSPAAARTTPAAPKPDASQQSGRDGQSTAAEAKSHQTSPDSASQKGGSGTTGTTAGSKQAAAQRGAPSGATSSDSKQGKDSEGKHSGAAKAAGAAGIGAAGVGAAAAAHGEPKKTETQNSATQNQAAQNQAAQSSAGNRPVSQGKAQQTAAAGEPADKATGESTEGDQAAAQSPPAPGPSPWARPSGDLPSHHRSTRRGNQGGRPAPVQPNTQRPAGDGPSTGEQPAVGGAADPNGSGDTSTTAASIAHPGGPSSDEPQQKHRLAWLVSAVALVAVIALVSWAAVTLRGDNTANAPTGQPQDEPAPVLTQDSMLNDTMAKDIDPSRTWNPSLSSDGLKPDSPSPACINPTPDGQPMPNISLLRGNEATPDNDKEAVLHRADAYNSPEEAAQIFNVRSSDLGGCTGSSFYVEKGYTVEGLGDQALAVRLVLQDKVNQYHTVLLVRTGTVVNIYDVARNSSPVDPEPVVKAASASVNRQCGSTGGLCASPETKVKAGIPPVGGDEPGFLASGDIPRITQGSGSWNGTATNSRINIQDGTGCEAVDFNTVDGPTQRQHRTYVLRNDPNTPGTMGVDEVVLTMGNSGQASDLVKKVTNSISGCSTRTLTGEASKANPITTPGEGGTQISGNWFSVTQKTGEGKTAKYRVGVFSAGQKFVYIRSNAFENFDFVDEAWVALNLRAGERLTQAR